MTEWSPTQYLQFEKQRTQPAIDLAARVADRSVRTAVDVGCGPGNSTAVLAVQMPMNEAEPLYRIIREVTAEAKWGFQNVCLETNETCKPEVYCDILSDCASSFDMWEIKYYHSLSDHRALIEWDRGTRLRPYLAFLDENGRAALEAELLSRAAKAYPLTRSGEVLLGFRRFFFMAVR